MIKRGVDTDLCYVYIYDYGSDCETVITQIHPSVYTSVSIPYWRDSNLSVYIGDLPRHNR